MGSRVPFTSALVTGASSGIGEAITRRLAEAEVPTIVVARRTDRLEALAAEYDGVAEIEVLGADLTEPSGLAAVTDRIRDVSAPVDLVVNNAGFGSTGTFHELDADRLALEIDLNVGALTRLSHAALQVMVPRRRGWLLNVSSVGGFQPVPWLAVYAATKAYVTSLSESLHEEVRGTGVHVTALCPGLTRTEFMDVSGLGGTEARYPAIAWTSVDEVVETGLRDVIANRAVSVPGLQYKAMATMSNVTPRWLRRRWSAIAQQF